jgi:uncharacterized protein (TIGR00661 family)
MKIFYAVQATGNGHISRAKEIFPILSKYGEVDIFLSGSNFSLKTDLPIAYRSKGISLHYDKNNGSVDVMKSIFSVNLKKVWQEALHLPVEKYDLVINDFECITSLSCKLKHIPSIHFGHQASFMSKNVPRPEKKNIVGEYILKNYAQGTKQLGLHFEEYDSNILSPIIKSEILQAEPAEKGHITVYLGHISDEAIEKQLSKIRDFRFEVFSGKVTQPFTRANIQFYPTNPALFNMSMLNCNGIITGSGFETPAEALYLGKSLMVNPMKGQYEQLCNAEALKKFNAQILMDWDDTFINTFYEWMNNKNQSLLKLNHSTEDIIEHLMTLHSDIKIKQKKVLNKDVVSNHQQFQFWEQTSHQSMPTSSPEYISVKQAQ